MCSFICCLLKPSETKSDKPDRPPKVPRGDPDRKRKPNAPNKQASGNKAQEDGTPGGAPEHHWLAHGD